MSVDVEDILGRKNSNGQSGKGSVVQYPPATGSMLGEYVINIASVADDLPAWGSSPGARDIALRQFWPTEPILSSAIFSTVARYSAFGWVLDGPERMVNLTTNMLHSCDAGGGFIPFLVKLLTDMFTQDNGAFFETVRTDDDARAPVVTMNHLDSGRCIRTGNPVEPVIYYDLNGKYHRMKYYQVSDLCEFPSPIQWGRGMQYCAVTRMLRAAQIMRDISIYHREKISGRWTRSIFLVGGVQSRTIDDALARRGMEADSQGLARFMQPLIIGALDPTANVKVEELALAKVPDGWDYDTFMKWYINQMALAFAADYQEYAPLPGGNLGSAQQSETLHLKSRGKGPKLFMNLLEQKFNYHGILPRNVNFVFGDQDVAEDMQHARLRLTRAQERAERIKSGEIDAKMARQLAVDSGDLDEEYLTLLDERDVTPNKPIDENKTPSAAS